MRLNIAENAYARLKSGKRATVPGALTNSELLRRVISADPEVMMPTPKSYSNLGVNEKTMLLRRLEQGA